MADDYSPPKINKRGLLTTPYPIRTRGDVSRARVLPQPELDSAAPLASEAAKALAAPKAPARDRSLDQPKGAFDYVKKRNELMKGGGRPVSGRR